MIFFSLSAILFLFFAEHQSYHLKDNTRPNNGNKNALFVVVSLWNNIVFRNVMIRCTFEYVGAMHNITFMSLLKP